MRRILPTPALVLAIPLLLGACADLDVTNPFDPSREQVLTTYDDVEAHVVWAFSHWYRGAHRHKAMFWLQNLSFEGATMSCFMGDSGIPRLAPVNDPTSPYYDGNVPYPWQRVYQSLVAVADGLATLDAQPTLRGPGATDVVRLRAFAKTIQAVGHAGLAVLYDRAVIRDETTDLAVAATQPELVPYPEVMEAAYGYFDEAIALAESEEFTIPADWMSVEVSSSQLAALLHSWRAVFRASLPRWKDEAVDWDAVVADLDAGLTDTFSMEANPYEGFYNGAFDLSGGPEGWGAETLFILGMADQSGNYQTWLAMELEDRVPWLGPGFLDYENQPLLIVTPDTRFPRGSTLAEQDTLPGEYWLIPREETIGYDVGEHFYAPRRGSWRFSHYYYPVSLDYWYYIDFTVPLITTAELDLLRAEAMLAGGDAAGAAALVNRYRTAHGLDATDATGTNSSCVPRLPDGSCGGLMEMLKWEKRMEVHAVGLFNTGWYFDSRRWGDHYLGTPLQWPVPGEDLHVLDLPIYSLGGEGQGPPDASPGSTYGWATQQAPPAAGSHSGC